MNVSSRRSWVLAMILVAVAYAVMGVVFAALADANHVRLWRLAAWVGSAVVYAAHIGYEHHQLGSSPRSTALHVAGAAALGAFGLALAANVHALWAASANQYLLAFALVLWPIMTAVPAFVVALAAAAGLARWRPRI